MLALLAFAALGRIIDTAIGFQLVIPYDYFGIVLVLAGLSLRFWGSLTIFTWGKGTPLPSKPPSMLVTTGPYRFIRNPLYFGGILLYLGMLVTIPTLLFAVAGLIAWPITLVMISREERGLEEKFGEPYRRYKQAVPGWIPRKKENRQT